MSDKPFKKQADFIVFIYDLYFLRYEKEGKPWYELTDYLRAKLVEDGFEIRYDDVEKNISFVTPEGLMGDIKSIVEHKNK